MIIAQSRDVKVGVFDIEAMRELFDVGVYNPDTKEWREFQVSAYKNELYDFVKFYTTHQYDYWVSFNGIGYDHQVLQYVVDNHQLWFDLTNLEICQKISDFSNKLIDDQKYGLFPPYKENQFSVRPIDLFRIHHFDNEARRTSLKWCEFMMDMDVEEMPIHFLKENLTEEEVEMTREYRKHDVMATLCLLYITLGQLEKVEEMLSEIYGFPFTLDALRETYKGKNKIQDRFDVEIETQMNCMNWSDVKIGEEWNKKDYMEAENISDMSKLFTKKIKHPFGQPFRNFFPKTMSFKTDKLKKFVTDLGKEYVKNMKQEFPITIGQTTYTVAKGGLHSTEKNRSVIPAKGFCYTDIDVGSQYPNSIVKLAIYAPHLAITILQQFQGKIKKRFVYKDKAKDLKKIGKEDEARPFMSVQEMIKLCLNGGLTKFGV